MALIECKNVEFQYNNLPILSGVSFEVGCGDYLCIVGENGSGKTTLMNGLLGLKKPSKGEVILGENLENRSIGYLPQQTQVQKDFPASVYEVVISGCLNKRGARPFYSKREKEIAVRNMKLLEIYDRKDKCYNQISGGLQQRTLLARALCAANRLLILDEPVTGLDPIVTNSMYELINKLNKEYHLTVIMVSHDIESAVKYADHILHLETRNGYFYGTTEEYLNSDFSKKLRGGTEI